MRILVQRSGKSSVLVNDEIVGSIDHGLVLFVGFKATDNEDDVEYLVHKLINLRIFPDEKGVMNKSVLDAKGSILSISQFTLYADTLKGNRPSYKNALEPVKANHLYQLFNEKLKEYIHVETGIFGENMDVLLHNDGPVTILLER